LAPYLPIENQFINDILKVYGRMNLFFINIWYK
jgi:hypothetical protein